MTDGETDVLDRGADTATDAASDAATATDTAATAATDSDTTAAQADKSTDNAAGGADATSDKAAQSDWPDDWREKLAGGDDEIANAIRRYGSPKGVAKALKEAQALIRSGKIKRDMPDASDEKAMAEWRKEQGIPDDPAGYKLPEVVTKRLTDADKPVLASFTEFAHAKGAPQAVVDIATEWYVNSLESMEAERIAADDAAAEAAEDALRKDWAHGEYKANLTLAKRFIENIPGVGAKWSEARMPDGRRLGDLPEFVAWAADQGRQAFGDAAFASPDSASRHAAEKDEIEKVMKTDIDRYYAEGLDKKYAAILEREARKPR